jgi:hypothetical protein
MLVNEGTLDRTARLLVGIQMAALGLSGAVAGKAGLALVALGTLFMVTGISGRCLLYRALRVSTVRQDGGVVP